MTDVGWIVKKKQFSTTVESVALPSMPTIQPLHTDFHSEATFSSQNQSIFYSVPRVSLATQHKQHRVCTTLNKTSCFPIFNHAKTLNMNQNNFFNLISQFPIFKTSCSKNENILITTKNCCLVSHRALTKLARVYSHGCLFWISRKQAENQDSLNMK